ncbi:MAG: sigma 54-interacting transcriptional regulator, partial [Nitrospinae bacterium]|nr:sigma 54-interacting transcriptional regulator [Nitrospinota bacterium]
LTLSLDPRPDLESMASRALTAILDFMRADGGIIYRVDRNGVVIPVASVNIGSQAAQDLAANPVRVGECLCGKIADTGEEIIILDKASADPRVTRQSVREEGMEFYAGLPVTYGGRAIGVLCALTHQPYALDPIALPVLRQLATPLAVAMENSQLIAELGRERDSLEHENLRLRRMVDGAGIEGMIGHSAPISALFTLIRQAAPTPAPVLIVGESGVGKELAAQSIHNLSRRRGGPFVAINCGALADGVLESELFGHERGSFTGAEYARRGYMEQADGGTLFLDEVSLLSSRAQIKLLRAIQEKTIYRLGSEKPRRVDFRIVAAANIPLEQAVANGAFRKDLYYRLNVVKIEIPPLRARPEDIPPLALHFAQRFARQLGKPLDRITPDAIELLSRYPWPGNVRELQNCMERAVVVSAGGAVRLDDITLAATDTFSPHRGADDLRLDSIEMAHIERVLALVNGHKEKAARLLGIHPSTLWRKLCKTQ